MTMTCVLYLPVSWCCSMQMVQSPSYVKQKIELNNTYTTLGARDFSSAVSGFCQVFIVTRGFGLRPTPKIPVAREKNLWYPEYTYTTKQKRTKKWFQQHQGTLRTYLHVPSRITIPKRSQVSL